MGKKITVKVLQGRKAGDYTGEDGLVLRIRKTSSGVSRSWLFKKTISGNAHLMTIGPLAAYQWSDAQQLASVTYQNILAGLDGKTALKYAVSLPKVVAKYDYRFSAILDAVMELKYADLDGKNAKAWRASLDRLIVPQWGDTLVWDLTWAELGDTFLTFYRRCSGESGMAIKTLERFAQCLDHARMLEPDNPHKIDAQMWRDRRRWLLKNGLPNDATPKQDEAFRGMPAIAYRDIPKLWAQYKPDQVSDLLLKLQCLTVTRVGSLRTARWDEFDWEAQEWCIPAVHLKQKDRGSFTVPLSDAAMTVLKRLHDINGDAELVMTNPDGRGAALTSDALNRRLEHLNIVATCGRNPVNHGFRSTFREWADDRLDGLDNEAEWCLGHKFWNKVNNAYRKQPKSRLFLAKRRVILS